MKQSNMPASLNNNLHDIDPKRLVCATTGPDLVAGNGAHPVVRAGGAPIVTPAQWIKKLMDLLKGLLAIVNDALKAYETIQVLT